MADNKTEKPTPQRLKKSREEGQFLSSRGALAAVQFLTFVAVIGNLLPGWVGRLERVMRRIFEQGLGGDMAVNDWPVLIRGLFLETLLPLLELGVVLFTATLAVNLGMTRLGFSLVRLMPKANRLNPLARLKDLPAQNLKAVLEAALLIVTLGLIIRAFFADQATLALRLPFEGVRAAAAELSGAIHSLLWKAAMVFVVFGAVDFAFQYRRHINTLRMTKQEIRDENKRSEGDPHTKQRIRRLRRELLRRRMMREIPTATAVIVNPTHFAVAIRYEANNMACPVVVAKGKNWLALRIRQIATESEIPIIENPPLARALYGAVEVGNAISPEFYKAIAEILAYVYRLMGRKV